MNKDIKIENQEYKYYTNGDVADIKNSRTYKELLQIGLKILKRMPKPIVQVCGPVSTGGKGSIKENIKVLSKTISKLESKGYHIFSQVPFEKSFERIKKEYNSKEDGDKALLEQFYLPLFQFGLIKTFFFIHGWKSSSGARWENDMAKSFNIPSEYLPENFLDN